MQSVDPLNGVDLIVFNSELRTPNSELHTPNSKGFSMLLRSLVSLLFLSGFAIAQEKKDPPKAEPKAEVKVEKKESRLKELAPKEMGFKALFPGEAKFKEEKIRGSMVRLWLFDEKDLGFAITTTDIPSETFKGANRTVVEQLELFRDGAIANLRAEKIAAKDLRLTDKYPGREVEAKLPRDKKFLRARFFLVDQRLYQIMVIGSEEEVNSAEATQFLESLVVGK